MLKTSTPFSILALIWTTSVLSPFSYAESQLNLEAWHDSNSCLVQTMGDIFREPPPMKVNLFWWMRTPQYVWIFSAPLNALAFLTEGYLRFSNEPSEFYLKKDRVALLNLINEAYDQRAFEKIYLPFLRLGSPFHDRFSNTWLENRKSLGQTLKHHEMLIKKEIRFIENRVPAIAQTLNRSREEVKEWIRQSEARGILCAGGTILTIEEWIALAKSGLLQKMIDSRYYYGKMAPAKSTQSAAHLFNPNFNFDTNFPYPSEKVLDPDTTIFNQWAWTDVRLAKDDHSSNPPSDEITPSDLNALFDLIGKVLEAMEDSPIFKNDIIKKIRLGLTPSTEDEGSISVPNQNIQHKLRLIQEAAELAEDGREFEANEKLQSVHLSLDHFRDWRSTQP